MPNVTLIAADGTHTALEAAVGETLMLAATQNGVAGIAGDCGGVMSCATCHVYVDEPYLSRLPAPDGDELAMLDFTAAERLPDSRLSCQIRMSNGLDGLVVRLPDRQY
ncbi:MAG: 2Fe-2S iron-sulfur cluster-binding protein [Betaproteobacteria bacterium]